MKVKILKEIGWLFLIIFCCWCMKENILRWYSSMLGICLFLEALKRILEDTSGQ